MRLGFLCFLFLGFMLMVWAAPPIARRTNFSEQLHGAKVDDPYRWMEDVDSPETREWIRKENEYTQAYLDKLPGRAKIRKRLEELSSYTRTANRISGGATYAGVAKSGGRLFFLRQEGLQNQPVLFVKEGNGPERELLNPNTMSKEGTAALSSWTPSPDGKHLAYGIAKAGSDWQEWFVRDVATGKDTADKIDWVKFSDPVWQPDGSGFYYSRYPQPAGGAMLTAANFDNKLYFHRMGTQQSADRLIYERTDQREWSFSGSPTEDGKYLLINVNHGTRVENLIAFQDLKTGKTEYVVKDFVASFDILGSRGTTVYFRTSHKAPKGRIITIDLMKPDQANWKGIVAESKDTLEQVVWTADRLVCQFLQDAKSAVRMYSLDGKPLGDVKLPGVGSATWYLGEQHEKDQFYSYASYTSPATLYRYDINNGESHQLFEAKLAFDPSAFETTQVFYNSKDGTRIPMFITAKKGIAKNGQSPVLLYGYGGFNIAIRPGFSVMYMAWLEQGGMFAVANIRGGSEYGDAWHESGMLNKKQNVFDDFIAAGEWLIANKYTSKSKLAILGGSNGGLLVGACLNQRPDLFGAAIPMVGVMDMLRFHKFTIGRAWTSDYGSPDNAKDFEVLKKYSPIHNLRKGTQYPPTLIITGDHDDRVVPAHSFKYAAGLQYAQEGKAPILIRIETSAGHGAGKPTSKQLDESTDILSFLDESLQVSK